MRKLGCSAASLICWAVGPPSVSVMTTNTSLLPISCRVIWSSVRNTKVLSSAVITALRSMAAKARRPPCSALPT